MLVHYNSLSPLLSLFCQGKHRLKDDLKAWLNRGNLHRFIFAVGTVTYGTYAVDHSTACKGGKISI